MTSTADQLVIEISNFIDHSQTGLLQLLVAAARRSTFERIISCPTYPVAAKIKGLTAAVQCFREVMRDPDVHAPTLLAKLYSSATSVHSRKGAGQFFTSRAVAEWVVSHAGCLEDVDVCDPGAGTAVFAEALLRTGIPVRSYIGIENDAVLALCSAHVLESINAPTHYKIWYANFMLLNGAAFQSRGLAIPSLILANPPFVRSQKLAGRLPIRTALKSSLGILLSSHSGSMGYFLTRAADIAGCATSNNRQKPSGRLLFLLPKEAKGAAHSQRLRDDLRLMHGWSCKEYKIPSAQTGVDRHPSNAVAWLFKFEQKTIRKQTSRDNSKEITRVKDLLQIRRGLATGRNEFFVLTEEDVQKNEINKKWLKKVLPTRIHIPSVRFSLEHWETLRASGHRCWLLALPQSDDEFDSSLQKYLREGLRQGLHATRTAKALRTWFSLPIPSSPPDVFVTYFFRGLPRFISNDARVFHLTNILGGRFVSPVHDSKLKETIVESLNVEAEGWIKSNAGREYKGGLRKIEPKELSLLPVNPTLVKLVVGEIRTAKAASGLPFI